MKNDNKKFSLEFEEGIFAFEIDDKFSVWLINPDKSNEFDNQTQTRPANNLEEAKEIAALMLYAKGMITKRSYEKFTNNTL